MVYSSLLPDGLVCRRGRFAWVSLSWRAVHEHLGGVLQLLMLLVVVLLMLLVVVAAMAMVLRLIHNGLTLDVTTLQEGPIIRPLFTKPRTSKPETL